MTAGPISSTVPSVCQITRQVPPGTSTRQDDPSGPDPSAVAAATTAAQIPVPQERVSPTPRSCTRIRRCRSPTTAMNSTFCPSGSAGSITGGRVRSRRGELVGGDRDDDVRVGHAYGGQRGARHEGRGGGDRPVGKDQGQSHVHADVSIRAGPHTHDPAACRHRR